MGITAPAARVRADGLDGRVGNLDPARTRSPTRRDHRRRHERTERHRELEAARSGRAAGRQLSRSQLGGAATAASGSFPFTGDTTQSTASTELTAHGCYAYEAEVKGTGFEAVTSPAGRRRRAGARAPLPARPSETSADVSAASVLPETAVTDSVKVAARKVRRHRDLEAPRPGRAAGRQLQSSRMERRGDAAAKARSRSSGTPPRRPRGGDAHRTRLLRVRSDAGGRTPDHDHQPGR